MNHSSTHCPGCNAQLPPHAPRGLCPRCLLKAGLADVAGRHLHVRCPHCQHAIELVDEQPTLDLICPACDTGFSLVGEATATHWGERPLTVGRFQLIERLGVGAFGAVWKALDPELDRLVAVKIPRKGQLATSEVEQFLREARSAAQLRHPNIVAVHEVGRNDDVVFIVSELVDGFTLADRLTRDRPGIMESTALVATIARALAHAHSAGIVHRDLKPSNIMLDADGEPHVMDFGLAKRTAGEVTMTMEGQVLGTPAYMSPEQAQGDGRHADGRSDVYSLGVVLFELLTGEKPFRGNMRMLLQQVIHDDPPSPRRLNTRVPRDLETIVLKCLEKDPRRRYGSAGELADDLKRALQGEPIHARPISRVERTWRWCRRNPLPAALASSLGVVVCSSLAIVTVAWLNAREQQRIAQVNARLAQTRDAESRSRLVRRYVEEGNRAILDGEPTRAAVWFAEAFQQDEEDPRSTQTDVHQRRLSQIERQLPRLVGGLFRDSPISEAHFSPDGRRIAFYCDKRVEIIDADSSIPVGEPCNLQYSVWQTFFSPHGRYVAAIASPDGPPADDEYDGQIVVLAADSGRIHFAPKKLRALVGSLGGFSPDGERLFVITKEAVHGFHADTGEAVFPPIPLKNVGGLVISPDGLRLLVWRHAIELLSEVVLFDAASGRQIGSALVDEQIDPDSRPRQVFSPDGSRFATFRYDHTGGRASGPSRLQVWNSATAEPAIPALNTTNNVAHTHFSIDGSTIYAHLRDASIAAWTIAEGRSVALPEQLRQRQEKFAMSADGIHVAAVQRRNGRSELALFDAWNQFAWTEHLEPFSDFGGQLEFSPDGQRLLLSSRGEDSARGLFHIVDLASRESATVSVTRQFGDLRAEFSADGDRLLTTGDNGVLQIWDLKTLGPRLRDFAELEDRGVSCLRVSSDGRRLAVGQGPVDRAVERDNVSSYGSIRVWDLASGQPVGPEVHFDSRVDQIHFAADKRTALVTLRYDGAVLIDYVSGSTLRRIQPKTDEPIRMAALLPDGRIAVHVMKWIKQGEYLQDRGVRLEIWSAGEADSPESSRDLTEHSLFVFSPKGDRYLLVTENHEAKVCETATGLQHATFGRLHEMPKSAVFRDDGVVIAIAYGDRILEQWNTHTGRLAAPLIRNFHDGHESLYGDGAPMRYSADGRFMLIRINKHASQLFDAARAEPLSLPFATQDLIHSPLHDILPVFGAQAETLLSTAGNSLRIWQAGPEERNASFWNSWSQRVIGHHVDAIAGYAPLDPAALRQAWSAQQQIEDPSGETSQAASLSKQTWHAESAKRMEMAARASPHNSATTASRWFAAQFHLDRLVGFSPNDQNLRKRRVHAVIARITSIPATWLHGDRSELERLLEQSLSDANRAIEEGLANDAELWFDRGVARQLLGPQQLDAAIDDVAHAVELGFEDRRLEMQEWQMRATIRGLSRRLDRDPSNRRWIRERGELCCAVGDWQGGLDDYSKLIEVEPEHRGHFERRGDCQAGLERWQDAVDDYTRALDDAHPDSRIWSSRAGALAMSGRYADATADLVRARQSTSYPFDLLVQEALVRLLAEDRRGYQQVCELALTNAKKFHGIDDRIDRIPPQTAATIAWTCALGADAVEDYSALIVGAERALDIGWHGDPQGEFSRLAMAAVLLRADRSSAALESLNDPGKQATTSVERSLLRALAYHQLGQDQEARSEIADADADQTARPSRRPWTATAAIQILRREAMEAAMP